MHGRKVWTGLTADEKAKATPGLVIGGAISILCIPILLMGVAFLNMGRDAAAAGFGR